MINSHVLIHYKTLYYVRWTIYNSKVKTTNLAPVNLRSSTFPEDSIMLVKHE